MRQPGAKPLTTGAPKTKSKASVRAPGAQPPKRKIESKKSEWTPGGRAQAERETHSRAPSQSRAQLSHSKAPFRQSKQPGPPPIKTSGSNTHGFEGVAAGRSGSQPQEARQEGEAQGHSGT